MKAILVIALVSLLIGVSFIGMIRANPVPNAPLPILPDKDEPALKISQPINNTIYNSTSIHYSFTIFKPSSWFDSKRTHGQIMAVWYAVDKNNEVLIDMPQITNNQTSSYQANITGFSEGNHTLEFHVKSCSYYNSHYNQSNPETWNTEEYYYIENYESANFTIQTTNKSTNEPTPSPTTSVPEFPIIAIIQLLGALLSATIIIRIKSRKFNEKLLKQTSTN